MDVINIESGVLIKSFRIPDELEEGPRDWDPRWEPNGKRLWTCVWGYWDVDSGHFTSMPEGGKLLSWSGSGRNGLEIIDPRIGKTIGSWNFMEPWPWGLQFTQDGQRAIVTSNGGVTSVVSLSDGRRIRTFLSEMPKVHSLAFGPNGKELFVFRPGDPPVVWNRFGKWHEESQSSEGETSTWETPPVESGIGDPRVSSIAWIPNVGQKAWGNSAGQIEPNFEGGLESHHSAIRGLACPSSQPWLLAGSEDGHVVLLDLSTRKPLRFFVGATRGLNSVSVSGDSAVIAAGGKEGICVWNGSTGEKTHSLSTEGHWVSGVSVSPDGRTLAASILDGSIRVWDLNSGRLMWSKNLHEGWASAVAISPDGLELATGGVDGRVNVISLKNGQLRRKGGGSEPWLNDESQLFASRSVASLAWSKSGKTLAIRIGNIVRVVDSRNLIVKGKMNEMDLSWHEWGD